VNGDEYLAKTESAARRLFDGIADYSEIVQRSIPPVYSGSGLLDDDAVRAVYEAWRRRNLDAIEASLAAQREYSAEWYAMAAICGALFEVAVQGIRQCNRLSPIPPAFRDVMKPSHAAAPFCTGRSVRGVPLGLVIYAGRNQHAHHEDAGFRPVPTRVFELLAFKHGIPGAAGIPDPAFDLQARRLTTYAHNITSLIEWRSYERYEADMRSLLSTAS
jgi:hypothetical protein